MQVMSLRGNATSQRVTASTALAEGAMEWLQSLPPDATVFNADVTGQPVDNGPFDPNGKVSMEGGGTMTVTYDIDTTPPLGPGATSFPESVVLITVKVAHSAPAVP